MKEIVFTSLMFFIPASFIERITQLQVRAISGKVIGFDDSLPIEGVTVATKGAHKTTGTQADGSFYITIEAPADSILLISHSGYQVHE